MARHPMDKSVCDSTSSRGRAKFDRLLASDLGGGQRKKAWRPLALFKAMLLAACYDLKLAEAIRTEREFGGSAKF